MKEAKDVIINGMTLVEILERHKHWLNEDCDDWQSMRADLHEADLCRANLCEAELYGAILYGANLRKANLYEADLRGADLCGVDLCEVNLCGVDLCEADLRVANLYGANLRRANLYEANLLGANLYGVDLCEANLRRSNLYGANLYGAKNTPYIPMECPSDGAFIGWKRVSDSLTRNEILVMLEIPKTARRSSATTKKCRCDRAWVRGFFDLDGKELKDVKKVVNKNYTTTEYIKNKMVHPDKFDTDRWNECSNGIHFFIDKQDAINY